MLAKMLRFTGVLLYLILIALPVYADVTGEWEVWGRVSVRASVKGEGSYRVADATGDYFVFGTDGSSFSMIDVPAEEATWYYDKKKFVINVNNDYLVDYFTTGLEQILWSKGLDADIEDLAVTKNVFTGTENTKKGTIKGKWTLALQGYMYSYDYGEELPLKATAIITFTGERSTEDSLTQSIAEPHEKRQSRLIEQVFSQIKKSIMADKPVR
jgi:hypothetical protein